MSTRSVTTQKIAVLLGGTSAERDVSLKSGRAVLEALLRQGYDAEAVDPKECSLFDLKARGFNAAFIALHGRGGEDGTAQAILGYQQIPYTGSDVLASALAMNKSKTKQIWKSIDLPIAPWVLLQRSQTVDAEAIIAELGLPLFVKPSNEGSSVGMSRVDSASALNAALTQAFQYDHTVIVESFLAGAEYTVAILGDRVLPSIRIESNATFYDYEAKYLSNQTHYFCPSDLTEARETEIRALALAAYQAIGCRGWGRVDIMCDAEGKFHLLEVNTSPGMTDHSLVPMAAKEAGITFEQLVVTIMNDAAY